MSGGSWDYVYSTFHDVGARLQGDENPKRAALGKHIVDISKAMRAIEWNDSGDGDKEEPALLEECVPRGLELEILQDRARALKAQVDTVMVALGMEGKEDSGQTREKVQTVADTLTPEVLEEIHRLAMEYVEKYGEPAKAYAGPLDWIDSPEFIKETEEIMAIAIQGHLLNGVSDLSKKQAEVMRSVVKRHAAGRKP